MNAGDLTDALKQACLRRLKREWGSFNYWYLGERLKPPAFDLAPGEARLGFWTAATRTISIAEKHVLEAPWEVVLETLRHEMAHQYVDEVLRLDGALPHGEAFRRAARLLAVDEARRDGQPVPAGPSSTDPDMLARLRKIRRLLALADSPNVHEAEAALAKANELLLKYNIDLAAAEVERSYTYRHLGKPTGRRPRYTLIMAGLLAEHFFVETIWIQTYDVRTTRTGYVLEICGTPENVDLADFAFHELQRSAHELWRKHKRAEKIQSDRHRRSYIEGVLTGFGNKLREQRELSERKHELVWVGDPGLAAFYRTRHPRIRSESYSVYSTDAFTAGKEAGAALRLTRALREHGGDGGRLLSG